MAGSRFVLIGDDLTYNLQYLETANFSFQEGMARIEEDLTWLGMAPDEVMWSTDNAQAHGVAAEKLGLRPISRNQNKHIALGTTCIRGLSTTALQPADYYSAWLTACRVVDDHEAGVEGFYRGEDLIGERQLYDYLARQLRYNPPAQEYVPLLYRETEVQGRKESKSFGAVSIRDLRAAGYEPWQIVQTLLWCAEVSLSERRCGVVVPQGYLETERVLWHPYDVQAVRYAPQPVPPGYPSDEIAEAHKAAMRERFKLQRGQCNGLQDG